MCLERLWMCLALLGPLMAGGLLDNKGTHPDTTLGSIGSGIASVDTAHGNCSIVFMEELPIAIPEKGK